VIHRIRLSARESNLPQPNYTAPAGVFDGEQSKAKRKPARRKTGERFAVLNAFADFTLVGLTPNEGLDAGRQGIASGPYPPRRIKAE